ncbi:MAG: tRNA (N6-isopentenyl adenosine(37)-C2)-methylthiotransferase MiaB [Pyrinomonadaceae bacterium]|nr:tRNA (N6-isopentenyl adenosine(37)-C2)-methylthiotransferase MiaB [Pyrinomonadaceae bacterium]
MKKVYLETYGCQMNVSDSERVSSVLKSDGYEITESEEEAEIVLINTCSVREKAEQKLYTRVGQIRKESGNDKKVGVLGCVAQLEGETLFSQNRGIDFIVGTKAVGRISSAIDASFKGEKDFIDLGERENEYDWSVDKDYRHSKYIAFVPIIEGCNKFCTYCIVPFSRGREISLAPAQIIRQVLTLRREGVREVHLIGQNVNSYRPKSTEGLEDFHGATPFSRLLRAVAATGIERIKFNTSFPRDFHPDIVDAINENENLCNWVHLPVQSGSNSVLRAMRRGHTIESYFERIDKIRESPRRIALTTDIIVGFPGEAIEDFEDTKAAVQYCEYDSAYIFRYSPRPGTPAFERADDVSFEEKTRRFLELESLQKINQQNALESYLGRKVKVLVEKNSTRNIDELSGHSTCHKVVNFKGSSEMLGKIVEVKISEAKSFTLYGEIC